MSKELNKQDVILHIETSINKLKLLLNDLAHSESATDLKRSSLLAYWIDTYSDYIKHEDSFNPKHLIKYNRGNIVQINFGFRVGNELGGLHYAVVLDRNNSKSSGVITVIPLISLKPNFKDQYYKVKLDTGLFELVHSKINVELESSLKTSVNLNNEYELLRNNQDTTAEEYSILLNKIKNALKQTQKIEIWKREIEKLKLGSIADTGQIITISKQKIVTPTKTADLLYGIKVLPDDMKKIDDKIKNNIL